MALPHEVESLDGLDKSVHEHYKKGEDGKFRLDVEGGEDVGALKRARDHEKANAAKIKKDHDALQTAYNELETAHSEFLKGNVSKSHVDALEASYKQKQAALEAAKNGEIQNLTGTVQKLLVDNVAVNIASAIAKEGSSEVLLPHIRGRLRAEVVDGEYVTRVLDKDGKPSAMTVAELQQEYAANPAFAGIILASKASGGGANGGQGTPGGGAPKKPDFATAPPAEIAAWVKAQHQAKGQS